MISISTLNVTQSYIRDPSQIRGMIEYLWEHSNFSDLERKIVIKEFDDGELYIHDGHHRILALYMAFSWDARLHEDEFILKSFKYEDFQKINWSCGWITPFNLREETRLPCVKEWKDHIVYRLLARDCSMGDLESYIYENGNRYKEKRQVNTIRDLYQKFIREQLK